MRDTWMAGDFGRIARITASEAEAFVGRLPIAPGVRVLDVACGTGNLAIPAARKGATVTGLDLAPNLLQQAHERAAAEGVSVSFDEGDAEHLPYGDGQFDIVMSMFGAMFAPRPELVASEFARVCRSGGTITLANWTAEGFVGKAFAVSGSQNPPPADLPSPLLWGNEATVRERLGPWTSSIAAERRCLVFDIPSPPAEVVRFFREYFGPTKVAFDRLDLEAQSRFAAELEEVWTTHNEGGDHRVLVQAEYLDVRAVKK